MELMNIVFVYGTLLHGEANHTLIEDSLFIGKGRIYGHKMYDVGYYPGIIPGDGTVLGELYEVTDETLIRLDWLEGEGSLYIRKSMPVQMESGETCDAFIYEYNHDIKGLEEIPEWLQPYTSNWKVKKNNYVWYVSYGSNMRYERFIKYIKGGKYRGGGRDIPPCKDTSDPVDKMNITIPFNMYFGNHSGSWDNLGVSFLDTSKPGFSLGVAYLVTEEQYRHIARQENGGKEPEDNPRWYNVKYPLGEMDGYTVMTLTNGQKREIVSPSDAYVDTLKEGLRENYPDMTEENIDNYLARCMDNR